jgi:hypothetical protein
MPTFENDQAMFGHFDLFWLDNQFFHVGIRQCRLSQCLLGFAKRLLHSHAA